MSMGNREVGAFEAKTHLSALLDAVEDGAVITITRHGQRIAELRPAAQRARPRFGSARGDGFMLAADFDAPIDDMKEYEG
jgi:prevent-host-death family protein